jgi:hypothetical protein
VRVAVGFQDKLKANKREDVVRGKRGWEGAAECVWRKRWPVKHLGMANKEDGGEAETDLWEGSYRR